MANLKASSSLSILPPPLDAKECVWLSHQCAGSCGALLWIVNRFQICNFVLGHASVLKLMFLGWPKRKGSSPLLLAGATPNEDLLRAFALPLASLLSSGLFDVGYGSTLVTLQSKGYKDKKFSLDTKSGAPKIAGFNSTQKLLVSSHFFSGSDLYLSFRLSRKRARDAFRA
jgi:hypothetical protein